ncbi:MAG TPA: tubulin-like doman-containing protein [Thermodesulfobacteriota bacterium]|nr:tubulin-like doman-containing protein [Thermodesulfobacteriota bacterium]
MLPAIVIGIGGTGKWVITDLKKNILETNKGELPNNLALLAFDLVGQETPSIERLTFEHGKKGIFSLDYTRGEEFSNFSSTWAMPIFDIQNNKGQEWPYIYQWLKEDDAQSYNLSREEIHNLSGAGQRRQTSRDSLFLNVEGIYRKIRDAVFKIGGLLPVGADGKPSRPIQVFIVNSIAGGTGCGTFLDFIYLTHRAIIDRGQGQTPANITAFLVIPRGFEAIASGEKSDISMESMEKNCFAAFRELQRHLFNTNIRINYSDALQGVETGGLRLLDLCYFIDGTKVGGESGSKTKHYQGTMPAIADYISLHLTEDTSPLSYNTNVIRHVGGFVGSLRGNPNQASIYSTFGTYRYVFDVDEVIRTFSHKLAYDALRHFLDLSSVGETEIKSEVQDFLGGGTNTPFNRNFVRYLLEHEGAIRPSRDILFKYLEFGVKGEDIALPNLRLKAKEDIQISGRVFSKIPFGEVESQATSRIEANLGKEDDRCTPRSSTKSYHGVLNYYFDLHTEKFTAILKREVIRILEEGDRKGNLEHARKFLAHLALSYDVFIKSLKNSYKDLGIDDKIRKATQKIGELKARNKQKEYLTELKNLTEHRQHDLVMKYIIRIAEAHKQLCESFLGQIHSWMATFNEGVKFVQAAYREHSEVRIDKTSIRVREYVTLPEDEHERTLYQLIFRRDPPADSLMNNLYRKLPHPDFGDVIRTFIWAFDQPDRDLNTLCCLLSAEFSPWDKLKENPVEWNYEFVDKFLRLGQFSGLRNVSIMDILALKKVKASDLANELRRKSLPLADFSEAEQQRGEIGTGAARVTSDNIQVFAEWNVSPPGRDFAEVLAREFPPNQPAFHDPHRIIRYETKHFIKMKGFTNLTATEGAYRDHYRKVVTKNAKLIPIHNYLADKHAARYEVKMDTILGEPVRSLNPRAVNLLEDEEMAKAFTLAWICELIPREYSDGKFKYIYTFTVRDKQEAVELGEDLVTALESLIFSDNTLIRDTGKDIKKRIKQFDWEKAGSPQSYSTELKEKYAGLSVDKDETPESDLRRIMKIILWEHADRMEQENEQRQ